MSNKVYLIVFIFSTVLLVVIASFSLKWRVVHDSSIMFYIAFLMDKYHLIPYKDIFDMNMPGTYFIYILIGKFLGYNDLGFRIADLIYLTAILTTTYLWVRRISWKVGWCSVLLFGIYYLGWGQMMSLQREYLIILPISLSILTILSQRLNNTIKGFIIGLLSGISFSIKPHSAISLLAFIIFIMIYSNRNNKYDKPIILKSLSILLSSFVGFILIFLAIFIYLKKISALNNFLDISNNYWSLYTQITGYNKVLSGVDRVKYLLSCYLTFGNCDLWLLPAGFGLYISLFRSKLSEDKKRIIVLLVIMTICFSLYPIFAGKFYFYHWLIFVYFLLILSSLCLIDLSNSIKRFERIIPVIILTLAIISRIHPPGEFIEQIIKGSEININKGRVDEISEYLKSHLKPTDKVQPLDWTGGAVHAMLIARAQIATPFIYDFHFYHHISTPYIQNLRKEFIEKLKISKPRFIIQIETLKPWVWGEDTTKDFPELKEILKSDYYVSLIGNGYNILERK